MFSDKEDNPREPLLPKYPDAINNKDAPKSPKQYDVLTITPSTSMNIQQDNLSRSMIFKSHSWKGVVLDEDGTTDQNNTGEWMDASNGCCILDANGTFFICSLRKNM